MNKRNLLIGLLTFAIGFGATFYIMRTYFPKHKVAQIKPLEDTLNINKK